MSEWILSKKSTNNKYWGGCGEKANSIDTANRNVNGWSTMENNLDVFLKTKNRCTVSSSNPSPGHISWKDENSNAQRHITPQCS